MADILLNGFDKKIFTMEFSSPLTEAILLRRHKRFLVDVAVNKTDRRTIYCPNTGAMRGLDILGSRVWFSTSENQRRKYPQTWEVVEVDGGHLVGVNTQRSNRIIHEGINNEIITELQGYETIERDVNFEALKSRFDFKLIDPSQMQPDAYIEVKSVTMGDEIHRGFYPDALNLRASQQLNALTEIKKQGHRAVLLYCVLNTGINKVFPADHIDGTFGYALRDAHKHGVEVYAYSVSIDERSITVTNPVEVCIPQRSYGTKIHI